jgi:uncharacterized membrane protein YtjA (UPF0391 family)
MDADRPQNAADRPQLPQKELAMLRWSMGFLIIALIAALLGFGNVAGTASGIAVTLFWVFVVLFLVSLLVSLVTGKRAPVP